MSNAAKAKAADNPAAPVAEAKDKKRIRKKEAAPDPKSPKDQGKAKKIKEKKNMTPLRAALITAIIFLLLMATAAALLFFNIANSKEVAMAFLQTGDHPYQSQIDELTILQEEIRRESVALSEAQQKLTERAEELDLKEREAILREIAITDRGAELDAIERTLEETSTELSRIVEIYEALPAPTASKILTKMDDVDEVVRILNAMEPILVSDILAAMDAEFAARVSFRMLGS